MITDSELLQLRKEIYLALVAKSGVREWEEPPEKRAALWTAAIDAADGLLGIDSEPSEGGGSVALPDFFKIKNGTAKTLKSSSGAAAITLASLANGNGTSTGGRQAATLDLGEYWAQRWRVNAAFELAATPTAGKAINLFGSYSDPIKLVTFVTESLSNVTAVHCWPVPRFHSIVAPCGPSKRAIPLTFDVTVFLAPG